MTDRAAGGEPFVIFLNERYLPPVEEQARVLAAKRALQANVIGIGRADAIDVSDQLRSELQQTP